MAPKMSATSKGGLAALPASPARSILTALTVLAMVLSSAALAAPAWAASITSLTYSPSGATVGTAVPASTNVAVFTPATALVDGDKIKLTLPAGSAVANIVKTDFTIGQAASGNTAGSATA